MSPDASPPGKGGRNQRGKERASMGNGAPRPEQEVASEQWFQGGETEQNLGTTHRTRSRPSFVNRNALRVSVIHRRVSRRVQKSPEDARGRASTPRVVARFCRYSRCRPPRAGLILKHSACCRAVLQVYCFRSPAAVPLSPPWSEVLRLEEDVSSLLFCLLVCVRGHPSMPPVVCVYESTIPSHHLLTPRAAASCGDYSNLRSPRSTYRTIITRLLLAVMQIRSHTFLCMRPWDRSHCCILHSRL